MEEKQLAVISDTWALYSSLLNKKILFPKNIGILTKEESAKEGMRVVVGEEGSFVDGNFARLYVLLDTTDGVIVAVKYQAFGETALIGALEILSDMLLCKTYDQAKRITADLIDRDVRASDQKPAFPKETYGHINLALAALDQALSKCEDIPLREEYVATPVDLTHLAVGEYPDWQALSSKEKLDTIKEVIEVDVQPYVALDEGAVVIKELKSDLEVLIGYEGSCTTCYSSTGSTLNAIQQILRAKVHPEIVVIADLESMQAF